MSLLRSIQKGLPHIMRQCNQNVPSNIQRFVSNFPADKKWFDQTNRIIANQFGSTIYSSIESNFIDSSKAQNAIQQIVSEELLSGIAILQNRIGENNETILDIERKCQNGSGLNNFFQSTSILLMSCIDWGQLSEFCTATTLAPGGQTKLEQTKLLNQQIALAKLSEMMHLTTVLHNQIRDLTHQKCDEVGNKIRIILGDYFMAQMLFRLVYFEQPDLTSLFISILSYRSEAFFYEQAVADAQELTIEQWTKLNFKKFAYLFACTFDLVFKLAQIDSHLPKNVAFEFGKNLGLAISAFQYLTLENELPLQVTIQQNYSNTKLKQYRLVNPQNNDEFISNLNEKQQTFCATAQANLELLPLQNDAKECFHQLLLNCKEITV